MLGSPKRDGEGEGLVLEYSSSWMVFSRFYKEVKLFWENRIWGLNIVPSSIIFEIMNMRTKSRSLQINLDLEDSKKRTFRTFLRIKFLWLRLSCFRSSHYIFLGRNNWGRQWMMQVCILSGRTDYRIGRLWKSLEVPWHLAVISRPGGMCPIPSSVATQIIPGTNWADCTMINVHASTQNLDPIFADGSSVSIPGLLGLTITTPIIMGHWRTENIDM